MNYRLNRLRPRHAMSIISDLVLLSKYSCDVLLHYCFSLYQLLLQYEFVGK